MGIVGFFITLIVMFQVRSIRLTFRARARLPQITKDLRKAGSVLSANLGSWPLRKNDGHAQIKVASSLIDGALPFVPRASRRSMAQINKKLIKAAREFSDTRYDMPDAVWDLYSDIQVIITSLNQVEKNLNWE
jgi:hypothetical protein